MKQLRVVFETRIDDPTSVITLRCLDRTSFYTFALFIYNEPVSNAGDQIGVVIALLDWIPINSRLRVFWFGQMKRHDHGTCLWAH